MARERIIASNVSLVSKIVKFDKLDDICKAIGQTIKFYGPINFQFILEKNTKKIWIIEINPRLSGGIIFSIKSGFNAIEYAIKIHSNIKYDLPKNIDYEKIYSRYFSSDIIEKG